MGTIDTRLARARSELKRLLQPPANVSQIRATTRAHRRFDVR